MAKRWSCAFLSGLIVVDAVFDFRRHARQRPLPPTRSAGLMLNRSQMLLAKEILLEPTFFPCSLFKRSPPVVYPLFIVVKTRATSSGDYFQRRMFTRTSWGREAQALGIPVIYAVGRSNNDGIQKMLESEHRSYGDLLQFNYIDAYYNITIKSTGILHWFSQRGCQSVTPYVFIVDDDVLINIPSLLKMISTRSLNSNTMYGLYLNDIEPHPSGKWAVSLADYPHRTYPAFITGASTLYPTALISRLVERIFQLVERQQPIFFLDDVLIAGIIAEELGIRRAPMFGIEDCSFTDLFSRIIISECSNTRRVYVWSKFLVTRHGQPTLDIDRLIESTTYLKWRGDFKQTRNGTPILSDRALVKSPLFIAWNDHLNLSLLVLVLLFLLLLFIFLRKLISHRPSSSTKLPVILTSTGSTSSMLLAPVK